MAKSARTTGDKTSTTGEKRGRRKPAGAKAGAEAQAPATPAAEERAAAGGNGDARTPTREQIAERAYAIYRSRGGGHGFDLDDWLQAERELLGR